MLMLSLFSHHFLGPKSLSDLAGKSLLFFLVLQSQCSATKNNLGKQLEYFKNKSLSILKPKICLKLDRCGTFAYFPGSPTLFKKCKDKQDCFSHLKDLSQKKSSKLF